MAYVNHRAVPNDDDTATHKKAGPLFLDEWEKRGCNVITLSGTTDASTEAAAYEVIMDKHTRHRTQNAPSDTFAVSVEVGQMMPTNAGCPSLRRLWP